MLPACRWVAAPSAGEMLTGDGDASDAAIRHAATFSSLSFILASLHCQLDSTPIYFCHLAIIDYTADILMLYRSRHRRAFVRRHYHSADA